MWYNVVTMYVAIRHKTQNGKTYTSAQIVEGYREGSKVRQRTLLDISRLPMDKILAVKAALQGKAIVDWDSLEGIEAKDFGLPWVVKSILEQSGVRELLGEEGRGFWPTVVAMVANRIDSPCSKYSLRHWAGNTLLDEILDVDGDKAFSHKTCYAALDFLAEHQEEIEAGLFEKRPSTPRLILYDITSTYFEGRKAHGAKYGYSRDHRRDRLQIVIGFVTDATGMPVSVEVFDGNARDSSTVKRQIDKVKKRFGVEHACFIGDRGMRTTANIEKLKEEGLEFILALKHSEVLQLVEKHGPVQMGLFDKRDIAEVEIDGRRLVVCWNPVAGEDTKRRREELISLTRDGLQKIATRVNKGRLKNPAAIQKAADRVFAKWKMEKFFSLTIVPGSFGFALNEEVLRAAERLDGVYVLETNVPVSEMAGDEVRDNYKRLQLVERAFRYLKTDLQIRPLFHWKESRIKGHVFVCFLAYLVEHQMQVALKDLEEAPTWDEVVAGLRAWRKIRVPGKPTLRALDAGLTQYTTRWLDLWQVARC